MKLDHDIVSPEAILIYADICMTVGNGWDWECVSRTVLKTADFYVRSILCFIGLRYEELSRTETCVYQSA